MTNRTAFDRILASLHDAVLDDACWPACSALIDEACRTKGNMLTFASGQPPDDVEIYMARLYYRGERDCALEREYIDVHYPRDERIPRLIRLPDSDVVHTTRLYTEDELKTSAVYNEFLPVSQFRNGIHVRMDGPNGSRIIWSTADPVGGDGCSFYQTAFIRDLLPHLRQYVIVRQALGEARALGMSLTALLETNGLGIVHLDGRGRIVTTNDRAGDMLRKGDALLDRCGCLHARLPADDAALQASLARAVPGWGGQGAGGSLPIARPDHLPGVTVHINPVGGGEIDFRPWRIAAVVLVVDREPARVDPEFVGAVLGLTPAESRVAVLLAEGRTVRDIAASTGRTEKTVRWHVRQIFEKRGISRQADLVRQVLSLAGSPYPGS